MKKLILAMGLGTLLLTSCATVSSPLFGGLYTDVKWPAGVTNNSGSSKVGTASASSILGILATGDASINTAAKKAGISKISYVDYHSTSILGLFGKIEVSVYGE